MCEIGERLLVREDGMVKNISGHHATKKDWHTGYKGTDGYKQVRFHKKMVKVHRLVAEAFIGNTENLIQINHINHDPSDNRIENLEWCDNRYNSSNKKIHLTKLVGTYFDKTVESKPWTSRIRMDGKRKHLGMFATELEAHNAYITALTEYNNNRA